MMDDSNTFSDLVALKPREYQLEMFRESLKQNVIVAMDTGSGKTHIALLRIREELELNRASGAVWFLCPTVALCEQQLNTIKLHLPSYTIRMLCGRDGVDTWKTQQIWDDALCNIRVVVCTHQVLLDGLSHGFARLRDIPLIVFDEAHHCAKSHPARRIMTDFYHPLRKDRTYEMTTKILGLTASPVLSQKSNSLETVERNLDAITRTPVLHRSELLRHVHKPEILSVVFSNTPTEQSPLLKKLTKVCRENFGPEDSYIECEQVGEEDAIEINAPGKTAKAKIPEHLQRFWKAASRVHEELGSWTSDLYITSCARLSVARLEEEPWELSTENDQASFSIFLKDCAEKISSVDKGHHASKLLKLQDLLVQEMKPDTAALIFVQTRAETYLLAKFLSLHPATKSFVRAGTCVGASHTTTDSIGLGELVDPKDQIQTLRKFQDGSINLLIATSVCDEGLDFRDCNLVICFELPPNLKSFIQRRGRARQKQSKFFLVVAEDETGRLRKWEQLEQQMVNLYMDDSRRLEQIELEENAEHEQGVFVVERTGARLTYDNCIQNLQHFCDKLPPVAFTDLSPAYIFESSYGYFTCSVLLPISVDASVREFESSRAWKSQNMARKDAAFQACLGLFEAKLMNENLLPFPAPSNSVEEEYEKIAGRSKFSTVEDQIDVWRALASKWRNKQTMHYFTIKVTDDHLKPVIEMVMIGPAILSHPQKVRFYLQNGSTRELTVTRGPKARMEPSFQNDANNITRILFAAAFGGIDTQKTGFPLLFLPPDIEQTDIWLKNNEGVFPATEIIGKSVLQSGMVRHRPSYGKRYELLDIVKCAASKETPLGFKLKCIRLSKRKNFLVPILEKPPSLELRVDYLDPQECDIDHLPLTHASFGQYLPSLMYRIEASLVAEDLCETILAPVEFSNPELVLAAITTPLAELDKNYQRLEFLGDAILKTLTAIALVADHPNWHEGYLSYQKDLIVSNGRLAKAAEDTGLVRYIINKAFTGVHWRPPYNEELLSKPTGVKRELSTKVLADIVEAVIGAAFVDGGLSKALKALQIFLPELSWRPNADRICSMKDAISSNASHPESISNCDHLETILGHSFAHPVLLLEAMTHPSHASETFGVGSYQRFEFLGDALLDYIVTTTIFHHHANLTVGDMHLLRTAAVNGSFQAFCALQATTSIPVADLSSFPSQKRNSARNSSVASTKASLEMNSTNKIISLPLFLRHAPNWDLAMVLKSTRERFDYLKDSISSALASTGERYPWRLFAAFAPEKVYSDIVESTLAAVWLDTDGDTTACEGLLRRIGLLSWLEKALNSRIKCWHPKEEIGALAVQEKLEYLVGEDNSMHDYGNNSSADELGDGNLAPSSDLGMDVGEGNRLSKLRLGHGKWWCKLFVGDQLVSKVRGWNRHEVEIAAAEEAIASLKMGRAMDRNISHPSGTQTRCIQMEDYCDS